MRRRATSVALLVLVSLLLAASLLGPPAGARPQQSGGGPAAHAAAKTITLTISAQIDGRSTLIINGDRVVWYHQSEAAPGLHEGANAPTIIGGRSWLPKWPSAGENRNCGCRSSEAVELAYPLPKVGPITFTPISCRESCTASTGAGKAEITFDDVGIASDATYTVSLTYLAPVLPEPKGPKQKIAPRQGAVISSVHAYASRRGASTQVYISRRGIGANQPLRSGDDVQVGDVITTGPNTIARLEFAIGGVVEVFPGSTVQISGERRLTQQGPYGVDSLTTDVGRIVTDALIPKGRLEIKTNGGVIGIKG